jgi:uncharacterized tellurite resistance protein B-like protein
MMGMAQLKLLISLAQVDGHVAEQEKQYILNIGKANRIYANLILPLLEKRHPIVVPMDLTDDEKFEYIFSLIQLMKIDGRNYKEEILFCSKIASKLGYQQDVMLDLLQHVSESSMQQTKIDELKALTEKYLSNK